MAALKVQSLTDIAAAFLQDYGYPAETAREGAARIAQMAPADNADIGKWLDGLTSATAEKVFGIESGDAGQRNAMLKLAMLAANGAKMLTVKDLLNGSPEPEFCLKMRQVSCCPQPAMSWGKMPKQPLEMPKPGGWLSRLWGRGKKNG